MGADMDVFGKKKLRRMPIKPCPPPPNCRRIERPLPRTYNHYSNPSSQGALICETEGFPDWYDPAIETLHSAYADRIRGWDYQRYNKACDIAGGGEQGWGDRLPGLSEETFREFAKVALNLTETPKHVRVVHYYNVSNGFSCPVVMAIVDKNAEKTAT